MTIRRVREPDDVRAIFIAKNYRALGYWQQ
jgi:hypothetical protein